MSYSYNEDLTLTREVVEDVGGPLGPDDGSHDVVEPVLSVHPDQTVPEEPVCLVAPHLQHVLARRCVLSIIQLISMYNGKSRCVFKNFTIIGSIRTYFLEEEMSHIYWLPFHDSFTSVAHLSKGVFFKTLSSAANITSGTTCFGLLPFEKS